MTKPLTLYHYWRSTSSWRVRWALENKGLKAKMIHISLLDGESETQKHLEKSPLGYVPVLEVEGRYLIESVAIIEWLEETFPKPTLYPGDAFNRAHIRSLVEIINADTQPIQNLTVLDFYSKDEAKRKEWCIHFIKRGLKAYDEKIKKSAENFSVGNELTAADLFLIPQVYNASRFGVDINEFPKIKEIYEGGVSHPTCKNAHPDLYKP